MRTISNSIEPPLTLLVLLLAVSAVGLVVGLPQDRSALSSSGQASVGQQQQQQSSLTPATSGQQYQLQGQFDASSYKNIYEAIQNHPDLREVS